ncbi:endoprotease bli-like [Mytilus californianus]|uniref:endoprotease bli-like n=1 Tax=Mytilus californianus TaxID=6549 RepID=UPI0022458155|nr:endoprotease bli-like [Mytilus californianus]
MVSGAIALVLQANPNLSYRDVMHLLVLSSNPNLPFNPNDFKENAVGKKVSKTFGFGLLDIGKLVDIAETWQNINELTVCSFRSNISCSLSSNRTENVTFEICKINSLEHVQVYFKVESPRSGQLTLDLLSPSGTISNIIPGRFLDLNRLNLNMTVITVHFWGESSVGKWTLMTGDISGNDLMLSNGTTLEWGLTFYGTKDASPSSPITSASSTKLSSAHSSIISPSVFSLLPSSFRPTIGHTSEQDLSSVGDCEEMPLHDPPEETHVEIIVPVVSIVVAVIFTGCLIILIFRRKQIYSMASNKSCNKKIDAVKNKEEPCEFISTNGSRSTCV